MGKFVKKPTTAEVDINGELFQLDFGRDKILSITMGAAKELQAIEEKYKDMTLQNIELLQTEQKLVFKEAINDLLQEDAASERLFHEDDSGLYHSEVYNFITEQIGILRTEHTKYSADRVKK